MQAIAITIDEAASLGGPRRAKLYDEIAKGRLRAVKVGRATRILVSDFEKYLASLPAIEPHRAEPDSTPAPARKTKR